MPEPRRGTDILLPSWQKARTNGLSPGTWRSQGPLLCPSPATTFFSKCGIRDKMASLPETTPCSLQPRTRSCNISRPRVACRGVLGHGKKQEEARSRKTETTVRYLYQSATATAMLCDQRPKPSRLTAPLAGRAAATVPHACSRGSPGPRAGRSARGKLRCTPRFAPLLVPHLLTFHGPKQVTRPRPEGSRGGAGKCSIASVGGASKAHH